MDSSVGRHARTPDRRGRGGDQFQGALRRAAIVDAIRVPRTHTRAARRRGSVIVVAMLMALALAPSTAQAALTLLKQNPTDPATFSGRGGYSADGLGQIGTGGTIQAEVPAGSTVVQAYLYGTYFVTNPSDLTITLDSTSVALTKISDVNTLSTARADVTTQVATKVGSGGGITDFTVSNDPEELDGVALIVLFANPALPDTTIAVLDGSASQTGDSATFTFAAPLDKTVPGFSARLTLGSGFSFQGPSPVVPHECGTGPSQSSLVDVNGVRLTSCAGNFDDGAGENGALITVGGVGDLPDNPADPNQQPGDGTLVRVLDDELYDLAPLLAQGAASVTISTSNPSQDDNLFLALIAITARAVVTTENCSNGIDDDGDGLIDAADPDCAPPPPPAGPERMTGGGTIVDRGLKVHHGFTLRCDASLPGASQRLEVNWGKSNKFHLTELGTATCTDDPAISEGKPVAGFDTYVGSGTGRYNGVDGATAHWTVTDAGEPGKADVFRIRITDAGGAVVLDRSGTLSSGNHQAHPSD
jgi:hypothetical protein